MKQRWAHNRRSFPTKEIGMEHVLGVVVLFGIIAWACVRAMRGPRA
ncbi:hypothetical protein AZOA_30100 [Azoarcus sp. Aa7]|nr:hypothetical protein [Azoarcus sp. Aa7]